MMMVARRTRTRRWKITKERKVESWGKVQDTRSPPSLHAETQGEVNPQNKERKYDGYISLFLRYRPCQQIEAE